MSPPLTLPLALDTLLMKVIEVNGVVVPIRRALNFIGTVTWTDDPSNDSTDVQLSGGGGTGFTTLATSFTQPAIGNTINAAVVASGGYQVGEGVQLAVGGFYGITAIPDGTHLTLMNLGASVNAAAGATVTSGVLIVSSGPPNLLIQSNDALVTQRGALDFRGFSFVDDSSNNRSIIQAGLGTPLVSSGGALTMALSQRWGLFIASDTITFPATIPAGVEFVLTHDQIRSMSTLAGGGQATFQRGGGATYTIQDPDGRLSGGVPLTAASVHGTTDGATYRFAMDGGTPGVLRCISSHSSP